MNSQQHASTFRCEACGKTWPQSYCPECAHSIRTQAASSVLADDSTLDPVGPAQGAHAAATIRVECHPAAHDGRLAHSRLLVLLCSALVATIAAWWGAYYATNNPELEVATGGRVGKLSAAQVLKMFHGVDTSDVFPGLEEWARRREAISTTLQVAGGVFLAAAALMARVLFRRSNQRNAASAIPTPGLLLVLWAVVGCARSEQEQIVDMLNAAREGRTKIVEHALANGVNVNARALPDGWAALHYSAAGGHTETVRLLLKAGADAQATGSSGGSGQGGSVARARPLIVAEAAQRMARLARSGVTTSLENNVAADPGAEDRYAGVIALLKAAEATPH